MDAVLLDTDVFSFALRGDSRALAYEPHIHDRRVCLALMTVAELKRWPLERRWGARRIAELDRALRRHLVIPPDLETAEVWARVFTARRRAGRPISNGDCWIAATALRHDLVLLTHNAADYAGIKELRSISHG